MKRCLLVPVAVALASMSVCSCSGTSKESGAARPASGSAQAGYVVGDDDDDDRHPGVEPEDDDDNEVRAYGHSGSAADLQAISSALERYYAQAATGNGVAVCALLDSTLRGSTDLQPFLPKEYRTSSGSAVFTDKDCSQVETVLLAVNRQQLDAESRTLFVSSVRVNAGMALAVMRFKTMGERQIALRLEAGSWRVAALIDSPLL